MMDAPAIITDPWALLGATRADGPEELKRRRNALALATHPDKCPSPTLRPRWTARMAAVNDAFALAADPAAWDAYRRHHHLASVDDDDDDDDDDEEESGLQPQQPPHHQQPESARAARARAHAPSTPRQAAARAARRAALRARADDLARADADGACAPGAAARWAAYLAHQGAASGADDPGARAAAREARDAARGREDRAFGVRAGLGAALALDGDAAALLLPPAGEEEEGEEVVGGGGGGGVRDRGWTVEDLVEESLGHLEEAEGGSHKRRRAARRMLVGEAVARTARERLRWDEKHGGGGSGGVAALGGAVERLRIRQEGEGEEGRRSEADEEMEALEEDRRQQARKLEQYAETRRFRTEWDGRLGNEAPVRKPARPPNRKEARQMKKLQKNQGSA